MKIEKLEPGAITEEHDIPYIREATIQEITDKINEIIEELNKG